MLDSLKVGDVFVWRYQVPRHKTVPFLYPESREYQLMPEIFATGFFVGLLEWTCIEALRPHLQEGEGSLGTFISTTHVSPTPPGMWVEVNVRCKEIKDGNNIFWDVTARDEADVIGQGVHGRHVVLWKRFNDRVTKKLTLLEGAQ